MTSVDCSAIARPLPLRATRRLMSSSMFPHDPRTATGCDHLERRGHGTQASRAWWFDDPGAALRRCNTRVRRVSPVVSRDRTHYKSRSRCIPPAVDGTSHRMTEQIMNVLDAVLDRIDQNLDQSLDRLFALLRIASISTDPAYQTQCRDAAEHVAKDLATIGFDCSIRPTPGHPIVIGKGADGAGPRALFYGHYDVQPVDPLDLWDTPPFEPRIATLPDGRKIIVGRGACDDKGQLMTFVEACRAWKAVTGKLPIPITMMIEGEEECGSANLFGFVRDNAAEFRLDLALVCDTGMWNAETPAVTTALRGLLYEEVRLRAADRDLHSGLFGGAAQNPIRVMAKVLAAIHDQNGRITIPGFYDGVHELPADIRADLAALDLTAEEFLGQVGLKIPAGEKDRMLIEQISTRPTCDVNGIVGG